MPEEKDNYWESNLYMPLSEARANKSEFQKMIYTIKKLQHPETISIQSAYQIRLYNNNYILV